MRCMTLDTLHIELSTYHGCAMIGSLDEIYPGILGTILVNSLN